MILVLIGKSASGKDAILRRLVQDNIVQKIVSYTTRPRRKNEVNGIDYNFVTYQKFIEMLQNGEFFQTRQYHTKVNNIDDIWYYGSKPVNSESHVTFATIVDVQGAVDYSNYYGRDNLFVVYVDASDNIRRERAERRGSFDETEWVRRMEDDNKKFDINDVRNSLGIDLVVNNEGDIRDSLFEIIYEVYNYKMERYRIKNSELGGILR